MDEKSKGEQLILVVDALQDALTQAVGKKLHEPGHEIRWEAGHHAAFRPSPGSRAAEALDEIKVYWPLLNERVRQTYGLGQEMCLQELEFGEFVPVPVGEYPDLANVKSHHALSRSRSSSFKNIFSLSGKNADCGSDEDSSSPRGSSQSGKVLRRLSKSGSGEGSPGDSSPASLHRKLLMRQQSNKSPDTMAATSGDRRSSGTIDSNGSPSQSYPPPPPPARSSPSSSSSSKHLSTRGSIRFTRSYLSFRKRILIESVSPDYFHELTRTFDSRADYLQEKPGTLLPKVIGMIRLSSQSNAPKGGAKRKAYYVLSIVPFPTENHEHVFSLCLKGSGVDHGERIGVGPYSESLFLGDGDFAREHELLINTYNRVELVAQLASDLGHLQHHGRLLFAVICVATVRDPVAGHTYLPGQPLGPCDLLMGMGTGEEGGIALERQTTFAARHDLPLGVLPSANALLPSPTVINMERPGREYYFAVHEFTGKVSTSNWTDWFRGKVGAHEYTSRLLKFLKESMLLDGGDLSPSPTLEGGAEDEVDKDSALDEDDDEAFGRPSLA